MRPIDLQRRLPEAGRIRIGETVTSANGATRPAKREGFRLTSRSRSLIERAAEVYGGTLGVWMSPDGAQAELLSDATEIDALLMPGDMAFDQSYENWFGGICRSRCDGQRDAVRDVECDCDPEDRACKLTTRLRLLLPDLGGIGTWRAESHGYHTAAEMAGTVELLSQLARGLVPVVLRLEQRSKKRLDGDKVITLRFPVLSLDVRVPLAELANGGFNLPAAPRAPLAPAVERPWKPVPELPEGPSMRVTEQLAENDKRPAPKPRANAAAKLPPTGLPKPSAHTCDLCGEPWESAERGPLAKNPNPGSRWVHKSCLKAAGPAATQAQDEGSGEERPVSRRSGSTDPAPTPHPTNAMSYALRSKMFALLPEVFARAEDATQSGTEVDEYRRNQLLALCAALGTPGLESRAQIDRDLGGLVVDALEGIKAGRLSWDGERLTETASS